LAGDEGSEHAKRTAKSKPGDGDDLQWVFHIE
jgi:hypothetical protein